MSMELQEKMQRNNLLYDFYGELLTAKQSECFVMHYMEDYSLSEIGGHYGVTPQAIADLLKRTEKILNNYESKLGLLQKHEQRKAQIKQVNEALDTLGHRVHSEPEVEAAITSLKRVVMEILL